VNDTLAWCLLAAIIVLVRARSLSLPVWAIVLGLGLYALLMFTVVRRVLQRLAAHYKRRGQLTHEMLAVILLVVLASGWMAETLGVHALFGAFLTGLVMPRHAALSEALWLRIEALIVVLLLPLYFVLTGLRSSIFLLSGATAWLTLALILAVAITGKLGGSMLAARFSGLPWREAAAVGVLMNTHGMVELVILNIGFDLGIISPALFAMMVLMALGTTLMAAPLLSLVYGQHEK
jgi:Kef-type K+ transport system membrane component KefB